MHRAQGLKRLNPEYGLLLQKGWETLAPVTESEWHAAGQIPSCKSSWETEPGLCGAFVSPAGRALAAAGVSSSILPLAAGSTLCSCCALACALTVWPGGGGKRRVYSDALACVSFRVFLCFRIHAGLCCHD